MKKRVLIATVLIFALTTVAITYAMSIQQQTAVLDMYGEAEKINQDKILVGQDQTLSLQENPVLAAVQAQGIQAYTVDDKFAELIEVYHMTSEEQQYLIDLMSQGYEAKWLAEIFEFYVTCCEEKEIIQEIYDIAIEKGYADKFWVEEAYNDATKNVHGVLDEERLSEYLYVDGIEISDVKTANVLSRRGVYTIQQLLKKRQEGKSWSEIINEVYQSDFSENITPVEAAVQTRNQSSQRIVFSEVHEEPVYYAEKDEQAVETAAQMNETAVNQALREYYDEQTLQHYLEQEISVFLLYNAYHVAQNEGLSVDTVLYQYQRTGKYTRLLERMVDLS